MLISCRKVKKSFGDIVILDGVDLDICHGERIGLVGRNGAGKTTLANILTGCLDFDEGNIITTRQSINIGYLRQTESQPELFFNMMNSDIELNGELQRLVSHLGIKQVQDWSEERLQNLSGGEKTKLALAKVWASQPDLVILDEPTNHMDYEGVNYLIVGLAAYKGASIIISHDRYFLDQTVTKIAEIEQGKIHIYQGNYSSYREAKQKERESRQHTYESQQNEQKKVEAAMNQLKTWSDKAHRESRQKGEGKGGKEYYRKKAKMRDKAVKSQIKRLERMRQEEIERPKKELPVNFNLNAGEKGGKRLIEAEDICKAYGEVSLFKNSSFYINRGEKIGLLGPNGCGKTTLIKAILEQESLDAGKIFLSRAIRVAYVSQELPQEEKENFQEIIKYWKRDEQKRIFQLLIKLGIPYNRLNVVMGELSRGERMKIAMGLAIMGENDLLILDEPTNHLDLHSREALEESLMQFPGTLIVISHDRYFLQQVCEHMLVFTKQKITRIEGKAEEYLTKKLSDTAGLEPKTATRYDENLLLETNISRVLSELSLYKPDEPQYVVLDQEYKKLIQRKREIKRINKYN